MFFLEDELAEKIVNKSAVNVDKNTLSALKKASYDDLTRLIYQTPPLLTLVNTASQEIQQVTSANNDTKSAVNTLGRPALLKLARFALAK
ncbi:hypothetical protein Q4489_11825 [Thalassotalea sp. 1_MG-2023]|uniref:hypothetical protein n=1 Tax=Thalassotalea sp. 1_MG-2023 TaxID=3062680 RepID=UPI0026E35842|nr:hypothetical protein [Thalassotalea sp. 1_MG-2023]MDO6427710.1 hypothetical protein [Thalassotalea sp. 1_MG-2023]